MIQTQRLILRRWRAGDHAPFAAINADPQVADWLGGVLSAAQSDERMDRYDASFDVHGVGRWAVERRADGRLIGSCGLMPAHPSLPVAPTPEIGWRLARDAWGQGYATEAARAALADGFVRLPAAPEIIAFTAAPNRRSLAVISRLAMTRDATRDFSDPEIPDGDELRVSMVFTRPRP